MKRFILFLYRMIFFPYNYLVFKINHVKYDKFPEIYGFITIITRGKGNKISFGKNVRINSSKISNMIGGPYGTTIMVRDGGELIIGNNVGISSTAIVCTKKITIQDDVLIGGGCKIWDTDFHPINYEQRITKKDPNNNEVLICDGSFIGAYTTILKGAVIGEKSVIGANSVVSKYIPNDEIWAGNPIKFIKSIENNR